jgi:hypothetical protein
MKSEVHVNNLIETSPFVREWLSDLLGLAMVPWEDEQRIELLLKLPLKETLATLARRLDCDEDDVFAQVAARTGSFVAPEHSPDFTIHHLRDLDDMEAHSRLTPILDCDPWEVLDELFDARAMLNTLFEVVPEMARQILLSRIRNDSSLPLVTEVLRNLLLIHRKVEEHFDVGDCAWGLLIDRQGWLKYSALSKLRSFCASRGMGQPVGASILAAILQQHSSYDRAQEIRLDALAIIHIQQRINWITRQLREQSEEIAQRASATVADASPLLLLEQHLKFYELKAPASAWRMILNSGKAQPTTIREQFPKIDFHSTKVSGTPLDYSSLKTRTEEIHGGPSFWRFLGRRKVVTRNLIVSCQIEESDSTIDVLTCNDISPEQSLALDKCFALLPAIVAGQGWVEDIGEQILLAPFFSSDSFRDVLISTCSEFSRELIRGLILAGVELRTGLESVLDERLSSEISIKLPGGDLIHPLDRDDIMSLTQKYYAGQSDLHIIQ